MIELLVKSAVKAVVNAVTETEQERQERLDRERREQERLQELQRQKLANVTPQALTVARDVMQIQLELEKVNKDLTNIDVVIDRIRRILDRPENKALKELFSEEMEQLTKKGERRAESRDEKSSVAEEERKTTTATNSLALESMKLKIGDLMGRTYFAKATLRREEKGLEEVEDGQANLLKGKQLPQSTQRELHEVRRVLAEMDTSEDGMRRIQNTFSKTEREQKGLVREGENAA